MKSLTIQIEKDGLISQVLLGFSRDRHHSFEEVEKFVEESFGKEARIINPDQLKKRLTRDKGGAQ